VTNDPMEATFVGIHMWKQAVEKAKSTDVDKVRVAMIGQTVAAPSGFTLTMDGNHHLHKPVMIGEIRGDGSSTSCGRPRRPCAHSRGARSSRATRASRTSSARSRRSCAGSARRSPDALMPAGAHALHTSRTLHAALRSHPRAVRSFTRAAPRRTAARRPTRALSQPDRNPRCLHAFAARPSRSSLARCSRSHCRAPHSP
jgi:hypothetical protein